MSTLFISDLHLSVHQPALTQLFLHFLQQQVKGAEALYILGDLFESWIGDDNETPFNESIITALAELTASSVNIYFMPGNRDFLIGSSFLKKTGCHSLNDPSKINLYGVPTLLTHGDHWCTLDKSYMRFRRWARYPFSQSLFLSLPLTLRRKISDYLRSRKHTIAPETEAQFDIVMDELLHGLAQYPAIELIIHGHTHRPCIQLFRKDNILIKRFVLSDWHDTQGNVLVALPNQTCRLIYFS